jgi:putative lipoic acid-binding regulatory protein
MGLAATLDEMMSEPMIPPTCRTDSLIEYPSEFPIKIMGATRDDFAATMVELIVLHDPDFHAGKITIRASSKGNYLGLTATVSATSREQLDNIYRVLTAHPMVKVVL